MSEQEQQSMLNRFLQTVAAHQMTVLKDDGLYRHLRFQHPQHNITDAFELITIPDRLMLDGDHGTVVFSRLPDMFQFFRSETLEQLPVDYWSEKIIAHWPYINILTYDQRLAEDNIQKDFDDWVAAHPLSAVDADIAQQELDNILYDCHDRDALFNHDGTEFECGYVFHIDRINFDVLHPSLRWCMYEIVWGIQQYDKAKRSSNA